jgi:protein translocase SecG subunit
MSGLLLLLITTIHVVACVALMASILLQSGKGGLAGAFGAARARPSSGSGAASSVRGPDGALGDLLPASLTLGSRRPGRR